MTDEQAAQYSLEILEAVTITFDEVDIEATSWKDLSRPVTYCDAVREGALQLCTGLDDDAQQALPAFAWQFGNPSEHNNVLGSLQGMAGSEQLRGAVAAVIILWHLKVTGAGL